MDGQIRFQYVTCGRENFEFAEKSLRIPKITGVIESINGRKHGMGVSLSTRFLILLNRVLYRTDLKLDRNGLINPLFGVLVVDTG